MPYLSLASLYNLRNQFIVFLQWFCAVRLNDGVQVKSVNLETAQNALGTGSSSNIQAIIPMTGSEAGDPHRL